MPFSPHHSAEQEPVVHDSLCTAVVQTLQTHANNEFDKFAVVNSDKMSEFIQILKYISKGDLT